MHALLNFALILLVSFEITSAATKYRTFNGEPSPHFILRGIRASSVEDCFKKMEHMLTSKEHKWTSVSVFSSDRKMCYLFNLPKPMQFQLKVLGKTTGILESATSDNRYTTIVTLLDPALAIYWMLDNVS